VAKVVAKFWRLFKESLSSRIAWLLAVLHACCFLFAIANMSPPSREFASFLQSVQGSTTTIYAGRPFHFHYESILLKTLFLLDLPAAVTCIPLSLLLTPILGIFHVGMFIGSYIAALLELLASSVQWLVVGLLVEKRLLLRRWGAAFVGLVNRRANVLIALMLLISAVGIPWVNARSQQKATRRGSTSFLTN
jgi:hypothetical protein